ncbi:MAG TPA: restriction endonuclease subunit S [Gemmata sp.]
MNPAQLLAHFDRMADAPDAVQRLRQFVLDLAIRGKLVPQDPKDEPAVELLKGIQTENSHSTGRGANKSKEIQVLATEEEPFSRPLNWVWVRLGDICSKTGSGSTPRGGQAVYAEHGIPFLRSQNVHDDGLRLDDVAYIDHDTHRKMSGTAVRPADLLLNITGGSMGRCCRVPDFFADANISQHVAIIRVAIPGMQDFLHRLVLSPYFQAFIFDEQTGAGRGGLPKNKMDLIPVAIPPLAEQRRIVAKVNELMALCDQLEAAQAERERRRDRLTAATLQRLSQPAEDAPEFRDHARFALDQLPRLATRPEHVTQLRQTILNLAVRGKLVPQDPKDEPARVLLGSRTLTVAPESDFRLPAGWAWTTFRDLGETLGGGTPNKGNSDFWSGSIPWVSPKDMKVDFIEDATDHISEAAIENSSAKLIPPGSLLMVVRGMILAHSFPTAVSRVPLAINQDMKALQPFRTDLLPMLHLLTKGLKCDVLRLVQRSTHGTCKLLTDDLFCLPIPCPPLAEQQRIVTKVDELMALCDRLESQLTTAQTESRRLLEAVLHEALTPVA